MHKLTYILGPLNCSGIIILAQHNTGSTSISRVTYDIERVCCGALETIGHRTIQVQIQEGRKTCRKCTIKRRLEKRAREVKKATLAVDKNWHLMRLTGVDATKLKA